MQIGATTLQKRPPNMNNSFPNQQPNDPFKRMSPRHGRNKITGCMQWEEPQLLASWVFQAKVQAGLSSMPHFVNSESAIIIIYGSYSASEYCMKKSYWFSSHRISLAQQREATTLRRNPFSLLTSFHFLVDFIKDSWLSPENFATFL